MKALLRTEHASRTHCSTSQQQVFEVSVNFQFLQKTHFKYPMSGDDHLFTNIE